MRLFGFFVYYAIRRWHSKWIPIVPYNRPGPGIEWPNRWYSPHVRRAIGTMSFPVAQLIENVKKIIEKKKNKLPISIYTFSSFSGFDLNALKFSWWCGNFVKNANSTASPEPTGSAAGLAHVSFIICTCSDVKVMAAKKYFFKQLVFVLFLSKLSL